MEERPIGVAPIAGEMEKRPGIAPGGPNLFSWPCVVTCAILLGFIAAAGANSEYMERVLISFGLRSAPPPPPAREALVITANSRDEFNAAATLRPRGFDPLVAHDAASAAALAKSYQQRIQVIVIDAAVPGFARMVKTLRASVPGASVVVLERGHHPEDVGALLVAQL